MIHLDTPTTSLGHKCSYSLIVLTGSKASPHYWPQLRASKLRPQDPWTQRPRVCGVLIRSAFVDVTDVAALSSAQSFCLQPRYERPTPESGCPLCLFQPPIGHVVTRQF
ncbi:hypothetical protein FOPG_18184 [Fusarium oxysporum f. sp. conglutinans race 2 54008]|uniref:Uncharacterized protein n=1 Tax=Fusarium oxysporum f. sp. conglutinans race 2 54008 TaxID=1089457 RepID=X0H0D4_FUSOX|nr:hypothetical protein FOPG_18184 [Fusarium oxysporum f. sp. conglutinans race 2 54008]KAI8406220.1 hypothetical protein FOFC_13689 [Fusarium oxysporum]